MTSVYDSARLAEAYAFDRPPVHEQILHTVSPHAGFVIGRAERLPFPAGSFDLITAGTLPRLPASCLVEKTLIG